MENTMVLLTIGILGIIFFSLLHFKSSKKGKNVKSRLLKTRKMITQGIAEMSEKDIINNQLIGLDKKKRSLVFFHFGKEEEGMLVIPLSKIAYCTLNKQTEEFIHRGRNRTTSEMLLSRVSLLFFSLKKIPLFEFVFFDEEKNNINELPYLMNRAEYWEALIKKTGTAEGA